MGDSMFSLDGRNAGFDSSQWENQADEDDQDLDETDDDEAAASLTTPNTPAYSSADAADDELPSTRTVNSAVLSTDARTSESSSELRITTAHASRFKVSSSRNTATPASGLISENQTSRRNSDRNPTRSDIHTVLDTHMASQQL